MSRHRLDEELISQGFFATSRDAAAAVLEGRVSTDNRRFDHPGEQVKEGILLHVRGVATYVSRGGLKLEGGLTHFGIDPTGYSCLDVGCSTGGFTDCLLKHGARHVVSVDVGRAEFSWELRQDTRVTLLESTNICDMPDFWEGDAFDLAVCDVSFTSVTTVLPAVLKLLSPQGAFLTLVKPQFEIPHSQVEPGGIVRSQALREYALLRVQTAFEDANLKVVGFCESPIKGRKGNVEYLLLGVRDAS